MDNNITSTTGLYESVDLESNFTVYPNPVKDQMNIRFSVENINTIDIEIIDLLGKVVFRSDYSPGFIGNQSLHLNIPEINNGYYILKLNQNEKLISRHKLIIQN